jgi:transposase
MGRPIFVRRLSFQEQDELNPLLHHPTQTLAKRAAIIWLSSEERYRVAEISAQLGMHQSSVRYWIHRFNEEGMSALQLHERRGSRIDPHVRTTLVQLATTSPREMSLKFTTWTLCELRRYLIEHGIVSEISRETIRRILKDEKIDWRASAALPKDSPIHDLLENFQEIVT